MITYTRNFEDVILQRVFADIAQGNYIDVGAFMPVVDSNSYALYQKGWRGVVIEPLPLLPYWQQARPDDRFIQAAAGASAGILTLHIYDESTQSSSCSPETVTHWQSGGMRPSRGLAVNVLTLNSVIEQHLANRPLHLVSIDVEGMEQAVLQGLDLTRHRPWVFIIEATLPGTKVPSHQGWEGGLLAAGYTMAYFDSVNRYYLARERRDLLTHFALPPNVWDGIVTAKQVELEAQVAQLQAQVKELQAQLSK